MPPGKHRQLAFQHGSDIISTAVHDKRIPRAVSIARAIGRSSSLMSSFVLVAAERSVPTIAAHRLFASWIHPEDTEETIDSLFSQFHRADVCGVTLAVHVISWQQPCSTASWRRALSYQDVFTLPDPRLVVSPRAAA